MNQRWLWLGAAFICLSAELLAVRDIIRFKDGTEMEVVIDKETKTHVLFKDVMTGAGQKKSWDLVHRVIYEDAPMDYTQAMTALDAGNYGGAYKELAGLKGEKTRGDWLSEYKGFYLAYSLAKLVESKPELGEKLGPRAAESLEAFAKKYKESRFAPRALYWAGLSKIYAGHFAEGRQVLNQLGSNSDYGPWSSVARAGLAKSYLLEKDFDQALKLCLDELKAGNFSHEIMDTISTILIDNEPDGAKAYAIGEKLVGRGDDAEAKRAAHELKGCAAVLTGRHEEGMIDLLKADLLYGGEGKANDRLNIHLAVAMKALMEKDPQKFGEWEYQSKWSSYLRGLSVDGQRLYQKVLASTKE